MNMPRSLTNDHATAGHTAVSGLFNGLWGGAAMAVVILLFSLFAGQGAGYLGYFSGVMPAPPLQGLLMHLGMSSIYGIIYALLRRWLAVDRLLWLPGWLGGLVYALGLWALAVTVLLPAAHSLMLTLPWYVFFSGHLAYGLALGVFQKP